MPWLQKFKTLEKYETIGTGFMCIKQKKINTISLGFFLLTCQIQIKKNIQIIKVIFFVL